MNEIINFAGFVIASIVLTLTPGNDTIYIITRTISQGCGAGLASLAGITLGLLIHITAVSLGLAQIIAHSPTLFNLIQYGGAAYLVYLGIQMWRSPPLDFQSSLQPKIQPIKLIQQGLITNLLNPKILIFFLTLLPQFVQPHASSSAFFILGLTFLAISTTWSIILVVLAEQLGKWLRHKPSISQIMNRISGTIFMLLAAKLVWQSK
ncbi:LysE family translocator [Kingella kingae]|nr:LysE family translocator [Kingella kingae]